MVEDIFSQIMSQIQEGNYIVYGHSMGTLLTYELTKRIIKNKLKRPMCLFFIIRGESACSFELLKGDYFFILEHPKTIVQRMWSL